MPCPQCHISDTPVLQYYYTSTTIWVLLIIYNLRTIEQIYYSLSIISRNSFEVKLGIGILGAADSFTGKNVGLDLTVCQRDTKTLSDDVSITCLLVFQQNDRNVIL